jgi:hypothetical protein
VRGPSNSRIVASVDRSDSVFLTNEISPEVTCATWPHAPSGSRCGHEATARSVPQQSSDSHAGNGRAQQAPARFSCMWKRYVNWSMSDSGSPSPRPSPGGRGRSSGETRACIFFAGGKFSSPHMKWTPRFEYVVPERTLTARTAQTPHPNRRKVLLTHQSGPLPEGEGGGRVRRRGTPAYPRVSPDVVPIPVALARMYFQGRGSLRPLH